MVELTENIVYTEADKYLAFVTQSKYTETTKQGLIDKRDRLVNLGFTNSKEVKEANSEIALSENNAHMVNIITYFASKYPEYKYLPQIYVDEICDKYDLECCDAPNYTGTIPDENLEDIEKLNVELCDKCFSIINSNTLEYKKWNEADSHNHYFQELPLRIIIQQKGISGNYVESEDCQIAQKKDGIAVFTVLKPVLYEGQKHYLIVTAWELEESAERVINQRV